MKNNIELVKHVKRALDEGYGYVWGTFGQVLTLKLFQQKLKQYPGGVGKYENFIKDNYIGRRTSDCVGLIKSFLWWEGSDVKYNSKQDVSANGMYELAKKKGVINTMPNVPGICVWHKGHIGVYIGDGQVIEARGTKAGVIKSPLKGSGAARWTHWLECPFIEYKIESTTKVEVPKTKEGAKLMDWQKELGEKAIDSLVKEGLVNNPETWKQSLGEDTPQWLFWSIIDRIVKGVK